MAHVVSHDRPYEDYSGARLLATLGNIVWYTFAVAEILLLFRLLLRFVGASPANGFIDFIYSISYPFVAPFAGILGTLSSGRGIIEWDSMLAMAVYWVMASILVSLLRPRYVVNDVEPVVLDDTHHEHWHERGYHRGYAD